MLRTLIIIAIAICFAQKGASQEITIFNGFLSGK